MTRSPARAAQGGGFLLEALIGVLIFSLGTLGVIGLQARSIRHVNDAQYRSEAMYLANSVIGRMWIEPVANLEARYETGGGGAGYAETVALAAQLPGSAIAGNEPDIQVDAGPTPTSRIVTVTLRWQLPGDATPHQYVTTAVVGRNN